MTRNEIQDLVDEIKIWVEEYEKAGFTRGEIMQLLCRPMNVIHMPGYTPETNEMMTKAAALYDRMLAEMRARDDDEE